MVEKDFDFEVESTKDKNLGEILDEAREIAAQENFAIAVPKKKVTKNKNPLKVVADKGNKVSKASKTKNTSGKVRGTRGVKRARSRVYARKRKMRVKLGRYVCVSYWAGTFLLAFLYRPSL